MSDRDEKLDKELRFHLAQQIDAYVEAGMTREEAKRRANFEFGGVEQVKEECRESRSWYAAAAVLRDLGYGLRLLRRNPAFSAVAVLSIALGIGANTAIFSVIEALLLRSLPVPHPEHLLQVQMVVNGRSSDSFSYPVIQALSERKDVFASLGGFSGNTYSVGPVETPLRVPGSLVSGGFFAALELQPAAGRLLVPEDDLPGAALVAVISDRYWERNYQRDPSAIGSALLVEGQPTTIVGVTPAGFTGANVGEISDLTMTFQALPRLTPSRAGLLQAGNFNRILARSAPGLSAKEVGARLQVAWPGMASVAVSPTAPPERRQALLQSTLEVQPGGAGWTPLRSQYQAPLYVLMSITGLVLLVACANVANLLLARSSARRREIAIRLAIGASRGRIVRQLLIESLVLAGLGAALGVALARFGSELLLRLVSGPQPIRLDVGLNGQVLAFTLGLTVLTGVLFGLAPAFQATAAGPGEALKGSGRVVTGARGGMTSALVALQTALSVVLLIAAGLFVRTMRNLQAIDPGFRHEGVLMLDLDPRQALRATGSQGDARVAGVFREGLEAVTQLSGVTAVGLSNYTPVSGGFWSQQVLVNGQRVGEEDAPFFAVSPGFFAVLRMRLAAGRDFTLRDDERAPAVVIVNEEFVRRFIPAGRALGQRVSVASSRYWQDMEIVGVVSNAAHYSLREPLRPSVFVPFFQQAPDRMAFGTFEIRGAGSLGALASAVETAIRRKLPGVPVKTRSFTAQVENSIRREILMAQLAGFFGVLALALGAIGLYGLLSYKVTQRTSEIGIRMALGARRTQVVWMVLSSGLRLVGIGLAIGLPAALWASRLVAGMLYGLSPMDAPTIAAAVIVLVATGVAAGFVPARRASRVEPMAALRCE
jgi:putative ABC transport system permease protein